MKYKENEDGDVEFMVEDGGKKYRIVPKEMELIE